MIITKTPFRMSFFGGGTDMPEYFREKGGSVISTTFDKFCYVNVRHLPRFFKYTSEFVYSDIERVNRIDDVIHPAIREAAKMLQMHELRLSYDADLPARSGLGSSSTFLVGMLNAFYAMKGQCVDKHRLAEEAIYIERIRCNEMGGWQDQIAAAYGGFNRIDFIGENFEVSPIVMPYARKKALNDRLVLFYTGRSRNSYEIQEMNKKTASSNKEVILDEMKSLVDEAHRILIDPRIDLDDFGRLLDYNWKLKRQTGGHVSTDNIDAIYNRGIRAGALGGKLLGAGGEGFLVFYVPEDRIENVRRELSDLLFVPFQFETAGSQVIYYSHEEYSSFTRIEE